MKKKVIMCIIATMLVALAGTIAYKAGYANAQKDYQWNDTFNGTYKYDQHLFMTIDENREKIYLLDQSRIHFSETVYKCTYKKMNASSYQLFNKKLGISYIYLTHKGVTLLTSSKNKAYAFKKVGDKPTYWANYFKPES
ncbi:hypothetical protein [Intestinibaculum porci]|uniref:hypothetical protein n=1 Tax=Intestinibaculum porci TaxID=2487118 RepID=UPI00240A303C|nr:hypothetical protein [Intestinibaculum porci]MDD6350598.1 hypothetical protein [Intestinibaculum porci]MDD6422682.1 hypothetical protein [Intestinibaculum porci]